MKLILSATPLIVLLFGIYKYFDTRKREQDLKEFENYHKLIKELVEPNEKGTIFLDRQIAIVYELRNFPRYYALSKRIIEWLKEFWGKEKSDKNKRILHEMDLTIKFLNQKQK